MHGLSEQLRLRSISLENALEHLSFRLSIARVCEESFAFVFGYCFEKQSDSFPKLFDGSCLHFAQERFQLRKELFDGIEVRAVSGQVRNVCAASLDCFFDPINQVSANVVHEYNIAPLQSRSEHL